MYEGKAAATSDRPRRVAKIESLHILILLPTRVEKLGAEFLSGGILLRKNARQTTVSGIRLISFTGLCLILLIHMEMILVKICYLGGILEQERGNSMPSSLRLYWALFFAIKAIAPAST